MKGSQLSLAALLVLVVSLRALADSDSMTTTGSPDNGVWFSWEIEDNPPQHCYWVQADLSKGKAHLRLCPAGAIGREDKPWETKLLSVSKIAQREKLDFAVNGSFFSPKAGISLMGHQIAYFEGNPAKACGWTISDGRLWSDQPIASNFPSLAITKNGGITIAAFKKPPTDAWQMVSGCALLVRDGKNVAPVDSLPAPRTAVGIDASGKELTLFVADGRRPEKSVGLTMKETGDEMIRFQCASALLLDSGGSSTMVIRRADQWPVVNQPSDSHGISDNVPAERPVANALGIVIDKP